MDYRALAVRERDLVVWYWIGAITDTSNHAYPISTGSFDSAGCVRADASS